MASRRNTQNAIISSNAATVTVVTNPSSSVFMYIWEVGFGVDAATNITFNNGTTPVSGAIPCTANEGIFRTDPGFPMFTIDPGASFTITNSGTANLGGWCIWSN